MKTAAWVAPFAVAFGAIAVLGGIAYVLEREKRGLDSAVDQALGEGGWLTGFFSSNPKGIVTEGSPEDFTVDGTFAPTEAQILRSQPRKV